MVGVPETWVLEQRLKVGPFITRERYRLPDGSHRTWASRRHRKTGRVEEQRQPIDHPWWRPRLLGWWVAALFIVGAFLFALGSFPPYANHVDVRVVGVTYFIGSLFFTSAGYLQYMQTINAPEELTPGVATATRRRYLAFQPHRIDWWAASVQSIGTLLFNVSTFSAMHMAFTVQQQERRVWVPDMFGSIAFMVASTLAWIEVCDGWWAWRPHDTPWRIVALNLIGSIAFQISAIAAFIRPATGEVANASLANLGTFVGAIGFLLAAALLIPELADEPPASSVRTSL